MWRSATLPAGLAVPGVEHDDAVAQALRGHAEHAAELAAAEQAEPSAGRNRSPSRSRVRWPAARASRVRVAVCLARNAASLRATTGSVPAMIATANSPALAAPASPIANVATGMPFGICTIDSSESSPRRYFDGTGTPSTGTMVFAAIMPGKMRGAAGARDDDAQPAWPGVLGVLEHVVGHAMRGEHARLVGDAEGVELRHRVLHDVPVAVAAHHHARERCRLALRHPSPRSCNASKVDERNLSMGGIRLVAVLHGRAWNVMAC